MEQEVVVGIVQGIHLLSKIKKQHQEAPKRSPSWFLRGVE
jgi:hypothetical protein